jgi:hypothetical protein
MNKPIKRRILVLSDMHFPYAHPDIVAFLRAVKRKYKPDAVVGIGDEVDFHALSYHESDPDLDSPGTELKQARKEMRPLFRLFPKVQIVDSNHGSMVYRKAKSGGIPRAAIRSYREVLNAPQGWTWSFDLKLRTPLGMVYFCHGKSASAGRLASQYGMSCVQGHFHEKAQITYISTPEKLMFDAHTGCLADDKSLALGYNKVNPKRPIVSLIVLLEGIPHLVPMILNRNGRWIGRL